MRGRVCTPLKAPTGWKILCRRPLRRIGEDFRCRFRWVGEGLPVVLCVEVVEDFDFWVGVDVGCEVRGEDLGQQFVDSGHEGTAVHVLDEPFGLAGCSFAVLHGEFVDGCHAGEAEGHCHQNSQAFHRFDYNSYLATTLLTR